MSFDPSRIRRFVYDGYELDPSAGALVGRYRLDHEVEFVERITIEADGDWARPAAARAARLVYLLAGVSYYKAAAPSAIELGALELTPGEARFLRSYYLDGLGEFAYRNGLDLSGLRLEGTLDAAPPPAAPWPPRPSGRPLVPFGGGIDSIVTVEHVKTLAAEPALFVLNRPGDRFPALEAAAAVTGLPIVRAGRSLDPQVLRSAELGFRNGHVPITAVISAVALLAAALTGRDAVIMSNEWSASSGNLVHRGRPVNHQHSKSYEFELALRAVLAESSPDGPDWFSLLRPLSELRIARRFAELAAYHPVFRSCNRAFHQAPAQRRERWCGRCDKCCFIDLILSPFLPAARLRDVFDGREPLADPSLASQFRTLAGLGGGPDRAAKPWECVGEPAECASALALAAQRPDRADEALLQTLAGELGSGRGTALADAARLLAPLGPHCVPAAYATPALLG